MKATCEVEDCDRLEKTYRMCAGHYARWGRHGTTYPEIPLGGMFGRPRQVSISYRRAHSRLVEDRGPASTHPCGCGQPGDEWAYLGGAADERTNSVGQAFSVDQKFYAPMCRSCHKRFDYVAPTHCAYGHEYTTENTKLRPGRASACRACDCRRNREYRARRSAA